MAKGRTIGYATVLALRLIGKPKEGGGTWSPYAAARHHGLSLSTIYRAMKKGKRRP